MVRTEKTSETCIIVVDVTGNQMGVVVDKVSEVLDIHSGEIEDAPTVGVVVDNGFILGMGKSKGRVKILLNIERVLTQSDKTSVHMTATEAVA
jgi:purine-binding chemotaxis protein CheW